MSTDGSGVGRRVAGSFACLCALAFAACGDDRDSEGFVAEANGICTRSADAQTAVAEGVPTTPQQAVANDQRLIEIRREVIEDLVGVDAPEEQSRDYLSFVATRGAVFSIVEDRLAARQAGDEAGLATTVAQLNRAYEISDAAAARLGIDVCAGVLPPADRLRVEALTEEIFTTDDPARLERICSDLVTPAFIEFAGGVDECINPDEPAPESIVVNDVRGVTGVNAQARFVAQGGSADGKELIATYVNDGGTYRLNSLSQAAPRFGGPPATAPSPGRPIP
jgi:hypothetical protein